MLVIQNARIHTFDTNDTIINSLVIDRDRILAARNASYQEFGKDTETYDLAGCTIIPGLTDAHIHLQQYAVNLQKVDCETPTKAECLDRIAERASKTIPGEWILGHGWNHNEWPDLLPPQYPQAEDLDAISQHHPIFLTAKSLHAGWANTAALSQANISEQTPDPQGGHILRSESGKPAGILLENAMQLIAKKIPEPTLGQVKQAIRETQPRLAQMGLTGVHDFDRSTCFAALQDLHRNGELNIRVIKNIPLEDLSSAVGLGLRSGFGDDWLRIGSIKVFADGALGPRTAAMLQPYDQPSGEPAEPEDRGMLLLDAKELFEHGRMAVENGLSLAVHAIGDRANHEVLEAFNQLRRIEKKEGSYPLRHRIEHVQLLYPGDVPRLAQMDVIASMQPIHAPSDMIMADRFWGKRAQNAYSWRSLLEANTHLAFGSDAPVESPNPFWGLHAAVTRRRADGAPGPEGWYPRQRLTVLEGLRGYTTGAAYAAGLEGYLGRLLPGYLADLLVLDRDPFSCEWDQLRDIHPIATMIGGKWAWSILD
jgi:predicted amidohydrolase YtcJ